MIRLKFERPIHIVVASDQIMTQKPAVSEDPLRESLNLPCKRLSKKGTVPKPREKLRSIPFRLVEIGRVGGDR